MIKVYSVPEISMYLGLTVVRCEILMLFFLSQHSWTDVVDHKSKIVFWYSLEFNGSFIKDEGFIGQNDVGGF